MMRMFERAVVLAYHGVGRVDDPDDPERLVVSPDHLEEHIRLLQKRGYRFLTAEAALDVSTDAGLPSRTAVLTFDDGFQNWLTDAVPVLESCGIAATFYVCPGWFGSQHPEVDGRAGALLDERGCRSLVDAGMELGSHSMSHPDLRSLSDAQLDRELADSKERVEAITQRPCRTLAYPYGLFDDRVASAAREVGYEGAFDWLPGRWHRFAIPRLPGPPRHGARRLALKLLGIRKPGR